MARDKRYTKRYDTYLSPTEDKELIDYITGTYGNGNAEKLRNALRALFAEHREHQKITTITPEVGTPQPEQECFEKEEVKHG